MTPNEELNLLLDQYENQLLEMHLALSDLDRISRIIKALKQQSWATEFMDHDRFIAAAIKHMRKALEVAAVIRTKASELQK